MKDKSIAPIVMAPLLILLVPLIAMQFSEEWDWKLSDFIIIGILLLGVGYGVALISRNLDKPRRIFGGMLIVLVMLLLYVEMAVGLFGSPIAGS